MTDSPDPGKVIRPGADSDDRLLPRCCPSHRDLPELTRHLVTAYPTLGPETVARQVQQAIEAAALLHLDEDPLRMIELVARSQLAVLAGERADGARLDPESHPRKSPVSAG